MTREQRDKWIVGVRTAEVTEAGERNKDRVSGELTWSRSEKEVTGIERDLMDGYESGETK